MNIQQVYYSLPSDARNEVHTDLIYQHKSLCEIDVEFFITPVCRTIQFLEEWIVTHKCDFDCIQKCDFQLEQRLIKRCQQFIKIYGKGDCRCPECQSNEFEICSQVESKGSSDWETIFQCNQCNHIEKLERSCLNEKEGEENCIS